MEKLSLGTMIFGSQRSEEESLRILDAAYDFGIRCIDTAFGYPAPMLPDTYGQTNEILAKWGHKGAVKIQSKVLGHAVTTEQVVADTHYQLQALGIDRLDICILHWPSDYEIDQEQQIEGFRQLLQDGSIADWGLSNCPIETWEPYCQLAEQLGVKPPRWAQNRLDVINDHCGMESAPLPAQAYGVLHYGWLAGRYADGEIPEDSRIRWMEGDRWRGKETDLKSLGLSYPAADKWVADARASGWEPATRAVEWVLERDYVKQVVIGVSKPEQLGAYLPFID